MPNLPDSPYRFTAYPSATEGNPLLGVPLTADVMREGELGIIEGIPPGILVPLPGSKYDPLVVELHTHRDYYPHVQVYRNGLLIAHSEVRRREQPRAWE